MKRLLSMMLVLMMVLTFGFAVSVSAEGTVGQVVIYIQDFEGAESEWKGFLKNNFTGVKEDGKVSGNHNAYVNITPESVVYSGATTLTGRTSVATGDYRLKQNAFNYRMETADINLPYEYGKTYTLSWKGYFGSSDTSVARTKAVKNASGINHSQKWEGYSKKDGEPVNVGQWYGSYVYWINRFGSENTWEKVSDTNEFDEASGWNEFCYKNIGYGIWDGKNKDTINAEGYTTDTIKSLFFQWKMYDRLAKLLVDNKAYAGGGYELANALVTRADGTTVDYKGGYIGDFELLALLGGSSYVFDITADDVKKYDDMAKVDMAGNKYLPKTASEIAALPDSERYYDKDGVQTEYLPLVKTWHLFEDCTALKSAKKLEEFSMVLSKSINEIGLDDVRITASVMMYDDVVTISGEAGGTVKAVTNPVTGESQTLSASGVVSGVNDYFGTSYTVESMAENLKAVYNGEELEVSNDGNTFTFSIAPEKVTKNGTLDIITSGVKEVVPVATLTVNEKSTIEIADGGYASGKVQLSDMPEKEGVVMLAFYRGDSMEKAVTIYEGDISKKESIDFKVEGVKSFSVKAFVLGKDFQPVCTPDEVKLQKPPVIIFKFDDARPGSLAQAKCLDNAMKYLTSRGIEGSVGVLTSSIPTVLETPGSYAENTRIYKSWIADGHELWLHGYDHGSRKEGDTTIYEFEESYDEQKKDIGESVKLMKEYLGYEFTTFGASWNRNNDDTIKLLNNEFPQFKAVMFGIEKAEKFNALNINSYGSIESKTGVASYDQCVSYFEKSTNKDHLVLQAHPPYWDETSMAEFRKMVTYLENKGCEFMTPDEYRRYNELNS